MGASYSTSFQASAASEKTWCVGSVLHAALQDDIQSLASEVQSVPRRSLLGFMSPHAVNCTWAVRDRSPSISLRLQARYFFQQMVIGMGYCHSKVRCIG